MALRLAPPPAPEPEPVPDDFDHEFFRTTSLSPIELDADEEPSAPRSKLRTALHMLGAGMGALVATALCIYALVPNTGEPTTALPGAPMAATTAAASAPVPATPAPATHAAKPLPPVEPPPTVVTSAVVAVTTPVPKPSSTGTANVTDARVRAAHRALARGDHNTAIALARRVVDGDATRSDAWLVLGSAYDQLRDPHSARLAFRACALRGQGPAVATCKLLAR